MLASVSIRTAEIQTQCSGRQTLNAIARCLHRDRQTIAREVQNNYIMLLKK